jgi:hypothetical protein
MTLRKLDPLLATAKVIVWFFTVVFAFAGTVVALATPVVLVMQDRVLAEMRGEGLTVDGGTIGAILIVLVAVAALLGLMVWFLFILRRIIDSVRNGDPFAPVNADRLARMGWIALGGQLAAIPVGAMVMYLDSTIGDTHDKVHIDADFGFDGGGILLILILFILARVFRHGAAMREDLEGTV